MMPDCWMPCDDDCEIGRVHCWNYHRPNRKPDWHDPELCAGWRLVGEQRRCCSAGVYLPRCAYRMLPPYVTEPSCLNLQQLGSVTPKGWNPANQFRRGRHRRCIEE